MRSAILRTVLLGACLQAAAGPAPSAAPATQGPGRPNILLIVADDLGYADLGSYGSDIRTPNIDRLAREGLRFAHFQTAPKCAPTRAMLLSGNNNHVAGMARQSAPDLAGHRVPGYEASLSPRVLPFPRLLRESGYHTYMVGKWHLGLTPRTSPTAAGFERSFSLLDGAGNHWDDTGFFEGGSSFWADGDFADYPAGRYSSAFYTDRLIAFLDSDRGDDRPFFAYAAYTSPHWPLQVPEDELQRYAGAYDDGYDALRARNFRRLQAAGLVAPDAELPPRNDAITPWEGLTAAQRRREARKMELYAAMVENLDGQVGRLIDYLKASGRYADTLVIFMSDNGAAGEDFYNEGPFVEYLRANYDNAYEKMGTPQSFVSYDDPWAEAGSAPFARIKTYTRQGGISAPMIMAGPPVAARGDIDFSYVTVMDLAPTILELAGVRYPQRVGIRPMLGESMLDYLAGSAPAVHGPDYVTALFHAGRAFLRQGDWKISTLEPPFDERDFALFNLAQDPGEARDLRDSQPERFEALLELWRQRRRELGIILPEDL